MSLRKELHPKIISFDLDGTLIDKNFDDLLWLEEFPKIYARQKSVPIADAKKLFYAEYAKYGSNRMEWYDVDYWFRRFGLRALPSDVVNEMRSHIKIYPDTIPALKALSNRGCRMIVFSNSARIFLDAKIKVEGLGEYFEQVISLPTDWKMIKGYDGAFARLAKEMKVKPSDILHVGDSYEQDYLSAKREGCEAVLLSRPDCRDKIPAGIDRIESLDELTRFIA